MKTKKLISFMLSAVLCGSAAVQFNITDNTSAYAENAAYEANNDEEVLIPYEYNEDHQFAYDSVLVVLKRTFGGLNKKWEVTDFPVSNIKSIDDLTYMPISAEKQKEYLNTVDFHQILKFNLEEQSSKAVLAAISALESCEGVLAVQPNYYTGDGDEIIEEEALPFTITPEDNFIADKITLQFKSGYSVETIEAAILPELIGLIDTDQIYSIYNEGWFEQVDVLKRFIYIVDLDLDIDDKENAYNIAKTLYDTGYFYSVEMNMIDGDISEAKDTTQPFPEAPEKNSLGDSIIFAFKYDYSTATVENELMPEVIEMIGSDTVKEVTYLMADKSGGIGRRRLTYSIDLNFAPEDVDPAFEIAKELIDTGYFNFVQLNSRSNPDDPEEPAETTETTTTTVTTTTKAAATTTTKKAAASTASSPKTGDPGVSGPASVMAALTGISGIAIIMKKKNENE